MNRHIKDAQLNILPKFIPQIWLELNCSMTTYLQIPCMLVNAYKASLYRHRWHHSACLDQTLDLKYKLVASILETNFANNAKRTTQNTLLLWNVSHRYRNINHFKYPLEHITNRIVVRAFGIKDCNFIKLHIHKSSRVTKLDLQQNPLKFLKLTSLIAKWLLNLNDYWTCLLKAI